MDEGNEKDEKDNDSCDVDIQRYFECGVDSGTGTGNEHPPAESGVQPDRRFLRAI